VELEYRRPTEDEFRRTLTAGSAAFGVALDDDEFGRATKTVTSDRTLAAYDDGRPVGLTTALEFDLTIPGGSLSAGGVTWVGVLPTHRRRGILRELMHRQLADLHERGEPLAVLWASEAAIYGRFGYGIAAPGMSMEGDKSRFRYRDDPGPRAAARLVDANEAFELFPPLYERVRAEVPGTFGRSDVWWREQRLADPESWRHGAGPKFFAALELDGAVEGYAIYRIKDEWDNGFPRGEVRVLEAIATSSAATRDVWRFLFNIDLTTKVKAWQLDPGSPLYLMVTDPRALHLGLADGLWLRLVDVGASLVARSWATDDAVVIDLRDEICPWNAGRWRVGPDTGRTDDEPELALDAGDLAAAYLGAFDFERLHAAERVEELRPGALTRATALFRTPRPPYCPEVF
jgi:predicted acetyltransferase